MISAKVFALAVLIIAVRTVTPALGVPVSYTCHNDDIYKSTWTWFRDGDVLKQQPIGSPVIPALAQLKITSETASELRATWSRKLDIGVEYLWLTNLISGAHREVTTRDGVVVEDVYGTCTPD